MKNSSWDDLIDLINGRKIDYNPIGFIIDSPWIPGWSGISNIDYYSSDELWLRSNLMVNERFPGIWFMPGFWAEYGMCTEPSAFGSRMVFSEGSLPYAERIMTDISQADSLPHPDVRYDGMLPFVISRLRNSYDKIREIGYDIRFAVSRGPFNIASFLLGTTELMIALAAEPERSHRLLDRITGFVCDWLSWQKECFPSIDGVLVLDDLIGFLGDDEFREYAIPLFRKIFTCTGAEVRFLHNDAEGLITARSLKEMGVNMFNFSHNHSMGEMRDLAGDEVVLVGNIPPRDVMAAGTPRQVTEAVKKSMGQISSHDRIIWSVGGGMPPGVKDVNIDAFINAVSNY